MEQTERNFRNVLGFVDDNRCIICLALFALESKQICHSDELGRLHKASFQKAVMCNLPLDRATMRLWVKREEYIRGVIESTVEMCGDLQGIAVKAPRQIEGLSVLLLESSPLDDSL